MLGERILGSEVEETRLPYCQTACTFASMLEWAFGDVATFESFLLL